MGRKMSKYLEKLEDLIQKLESAPEQPRGEEFAIAPGQPPRQGAFRVLAEAYANRLERKPRPAEIRMLAQGKLVMRSHNDVARGAQIEVTIVAQKSGRGETVCVAQGQVTRAQRISGAYEIEMTVASQSSSTIPVQRRFLEYAATGDAASWNRWYADVEEGALLRNLDLARMNLVNFDLCCAHLCGSDLRGANLSNANLSGADLTGCNLDGVLISGADLFRAHLPRRYLGLLVACGMVEVESVLLVD